MLCNKCENGIQIKYSSQEGYSLCCDVCDTSVILGFVSGEQLKEIISKTKTNKYGSVFSLNRCNYSGTEICSGANRAHT